jgi:hypothetical protein
MAWVPQISLPWVAPMMITRAGTLAGVVDGLEVQLAGGDHASCSKKK